MKNRHGIEISYELGYSINKALLEGDTETLSDLLCEYLEENKLNLPNTSEIADSAEIPYEEDFSTSNYVLR